MRACIHCMKTTKEKECCDQPTLTKKQTLKQLEYCKKAFDWKTISALERLIKEID